MDEEFIVILNFIFIHNYKLYCVVVVLWQQHLQQQQIADIQYLFNTTILQFVFLLSSFFILLFGYDMQILLALHFHIRIHPYELDNLKAN